MHPTAAVTRPPREAPNPLCSILICAYGHRAVTEMCLASLDAALGAALGREFELVLVDNASPDDTLELFDRWRDRAVVISSETNRNFAGGNNAAAAEARGEVLLFLNNDIEVVPGALEGLVETARAADVGAAGLRLLYPDGSLQHAGVGFFAAAGGALVPWHLFHHQAGELPAAAGVLDLDVVTAACMAMPRAVFEELGGFDEGFVNGWEDTDLCLRSRLNGLRTIYRGDLHSTHHEGISRGRGLSAQGQANANRFLDRWAAMLDDDAELVRTLFDAEFVAPARAPADQADGAVLAVRGQLTGLAPEADEARAILAALEAAGLSPAARDLPFAFLAPRMTPEERSLVSRARARAARPGALPIDVPVGTRTAELGGGVLRLAGVPQRTVGGVREIWAASSAVADALVAAGAPRDGVAVVPPPVRTPPTGGGGSGVLVVVPGHDLRAARSALAALASRSGEPVRVLPSVAATGLADLVGELLAGAELLAPCASEERFAALAGGADVVVCADESDRFQRRALVAAATGTAALTTWPGPAAGVLGDDIVSAEAGLQPSLGAALEGRADRAARRERVRGLCAPELLAARLRS